jgi:hypothetical protein
MNEKRDFGVTLLGAMVLLLIMSHMTQCSSTRRPTGPPAAPSAASSAAARESSERAHSPRAERTRDREEDEESERVKSIGHALQTIGADPTAAATYGFPQ